MNDNQETASTTASFKSQLGLPAASEKLLAEAARAVRQEFRNGSKWKRLRCRRVSVLAECDRGTVFAIDVGGSVEFDWTWEGAVAFRPRSIDEFGMLSDEILEHTLHDDQIQWSGEILEVDENRGHLFLKINHPNRTPTTGSFFVRPFEFLSVLDSVYNHPGFESVQAALPARLSATLGGTHPAVENNSEVGLQFLRPWWQHAWSVLWGPPGTGKTYLIGQQVAAVIAEDPTERMLVISTTNQATDAAAIAIGTAAQSIRPDTLSDGEIIRVGKGATYQTFQNQGLTSLLHSAEQDQLAKIDELAQQRQRAELVEDKAFARKQIKDLQFGTSNQSRRAFFNPDLRVVVSTAFKATSLLRDDVVKTMIEQGHAPFTTLFIDEAGLLSRASIAALSFLASRRVVLVGDSKQLAPISRISRVLPTRQKTWLASSGLGHLDDLEHTPTAVHLLSEQRRMHPDVCSVVSGFQYDGKLTTAQPTIDRQSKLPNSISGFSRAIWYVLDEDAKGLASIRARRGPGNRSWVREVTFDVLEKLLSLESVSQSDGLFMSPYKAQAQMVSAWFSKQKLDSWKASTVHSQQGAEADLVVFDTVNAGSYHWPYDEWKRLVNVALSRAREAVILLASRNEMEEPYLKPLLNSLTPAVLRPNSSGYIWQPASSENRTAPTDTVNEQRPQYQTSTSNRHEMGQQFDQRRIMTPVLSQEQQRLTNLRLDGKPRLVRGVAGSGKSIVLCNWLARTVQRLQADLDARVWAVYANRSLHKLLRESIETAWKDLEGETLFGHQPFPWDQVELLHVKDILDGLLPTAALKMERFGFDYDRAAEEFLNHKDASELSPRCSALFIDEAQDMGPSTLRLLLSLVEQRDPEDSNSRPAHIFYDNAQNIYGRKTPRWSEFGLDMRGRSTIMRESFRSTVQITEFAVNALNRLSEPGDRKDQQEMLELGLIEKSSASGEDWLSVRYNPIDGPKPIVHLHDDRAAEIQRIAAHLIHLIQEEQIRPSDICLIYNGKRLLERLERELAPRLAAIDVEFSVQTNRPFERRPNTILVTTCHSFKGYEAEVILIPGVDQFVTAKDEILANNLYVAMTRARSLLAIYGVRNSSESANRIIDVLESCLEALNSNDQTQSAPNSHDEFLDILDRIGEKHQKWLSQIWSQHEIQQEPITDEAGKIIAEPLFWFESEGKKFACFDRPLSLDEQLAWSKHGIERLAPVVEME